MRFMCFYFFIICRWQKCYHIVMIYLTNRFNNDNYHYEQKQVLQSKVIQQVVHFITIIYNIQ